MSDNEYVVVTTISTFRHRYVMPKDKLQALNTEATVDTAWALDCVTCNEAKEFSQLHVGENIIDTVTMNEKEVLDLFDGDNDYLSGWTAEKKIEWIRDCWENRA